MVPKSSVGLAGAMETRVLTRSGDTLVTVSDVGVSSSRDVSLSRFSAAEVLLEGARI